MTTAKVMVVTGVTGSIGAAAARALLREGHHVVLVARDEAKARAVAEGIPGASFSTVGADLSSLESVRAAAGRIRRAHPALHALVNVAAVMSTSRKLTVDGAESMFGTNHLGPYLLSRLLLAPLRAGQGRVVNVSAPSTVLPRFEDLDGAAKFSALGAFGASKACNLLFTLAWERRYGGQGVHAVAFHPGLVRSTLLREMPAPVRALTWLISRPPEHAGEALARLATGTSLDGARTFFKLDAPIAMPKPVLRQDVQERLWEVSAQRTGLPVEDAEAQPVAA
ncbi:MAG TPA: SDR family NAD(P)-dependent oxidoreductase [Myxococcus sp.]|jgi:NAD(P)-dependent dehydrogenase (short-subunit alcohol dehydrogenase family)|nr:SDR family NAD(P)-dependent oxidoreductase [Myxococcus sp.]